MSELKHFLVTHIRDFDALSEPERLSA